MSCPKLNANGYAMDLDDYTPSPGLTSDSNLVSSISSSVNYKVYDGTFQWSDARRHMHIPVIDVDVPVEVVESTTPGHFHLYIDHPVEPEKYMALLTAMADCGIVEEGYARASYEKGFSAVRVPWQAKNPELDHNLEGDFPNDSTLPDVAIGIKLSYKFPLEV